MGAFLARSLLDFMADLHNCLNCRNEFATKICK